MVEKVKKSRMNPVQQSASRRVRPARSSGLIGELEDSREINAPGKEPNQVKEPEIKARHGGVIARIAQVEKAQQLLVDEVKPEEAVIHAAAAVQGKGESRADCASVASMCQGAAISRMMATLVQGVKALPGDSGEELAGDEKVENRCP